MLTLIILGLLGGFITGISPCILPVLPVILLGGADSARTFQMPGAAHLNQPQKKASKWRPYQVIGGLVLSFTLFTLLGTVVLNALNLPQDIVRIVGIIFLILVGVGMIIPRFEHLLEKPFSWIPQRSVNPSRGGFSLGFLLGMVYVPCAGPVLAAITVAGATGTIGAQTIALTVAFAIGTGIPLLFFALAGRGVAERVKAFRTRQRAIRIVSGALLILLSVGLWANVPAKIQRALPNYTASAEGFISQYTQQELGAATLGDCKDGAADLADCGRAPELAGINQWLNTPANKPLSLDQLKGKVVLVDFWAYSCINCQRSTPHLNDWYAKYKDAGLEIIGVHTPEYAFEHETPNVEAGIQDLGIKYPVAQDNDYQTWRAYSNHYWPARYLIDSTGQLRAVKFGEGDYGQSEQQIRELLQQANPQVKLPPATQDADADHEARGQEARSPETYLGSQRVGYFAGEGDYNNGVHDFNIAGELRENTFGLNGAWTIEDERITPAGDNSELVINYRAKDVQIVASGEGTLQVDGPTGSFTVDVHGAPNAVDIIQGQSQTHGDLHVKVPQGVQLYSLTFG